MVKAHSLGRIYSTLAINRFEAGRLAEATRYLARGFSTQHVVGECAGCDVLLYPAAVPIYLAHNEVELAEDACKRAEDAAGAFRSRSWVATSRYLKGLLNGFQGDWSLAAKHFEDALLIFESLGQPYELARTLQELSLAKARSGAGKNAGDLLQRAVDIYSSLGATYRAAQARRLLAALA